MKKLIPSVIICVLILPAAVALDVDKDELAKNQRPVQFENYEGAHSVVNTTNQIRGIGLELGRRALDANGNIIQNRLIGEIDRYSVKEVSNARADDPGLSADVIRLGKNAGVDHIRNLRQIVAGYLEGAWGYNAEQADELSAYITIYNVVYRGRIEDMKPIYKDSVISDINSSKLGLATTWREWAGGTEMLIPLYTPDGGGPLKIATDKIFTEEVVEAIKKDPDVPKATPVMEAHNAEVARQKREAEEREIRRAEEREIARAAEEREILRREEDKKTQRVTAIAEAKAADEKAKTTRKNFTMAEEELRRMYARRKQLEEEAEGMRLSAEKAQREVITNRFGIPIHGNETARVRDNEYKIALGALEKLNTTIAAAENALETAKREAAEDEAEAARLTARANELGVL
jgi:hypothetical protein